MKKIAFYLPHLDIQGTGVSSFDYAYYNEKILKNKSYFFWDEFGQYGQQPWSHPLAVKKFKDHLDVIGLSGITQEENMTELKRLCVELKVDALYIQKTGLRSDRFVEDIPTFIHAVGVVNEPHGTVYAYVSDWLSETCTGGKAPVVPYMIHLPETDSDLRKDLNIPQDAIVFGRTGGPYSWNIPFVNDAIFYILNERSNVYFLFANTDKFINHERVIFHEPFADLTYKKKFINTCDAFLHARAEGESFGASVAEFSICNRPVITFEHSPERNHINTLKDKGIYYTDAHSLYDILNSFKPRPDKDWNAYRDHTPENVMQKFQTVFIDAI